ncbi:hypothetical protein ABIA39_007543 [Nocardia sp. GAS34]|uniref:hypothetical protein n=1 Tax=unclassified Nocardia TaxID=2637762 RepID=UPI003D212A7A
MTHSISGVNSLPSWKLRLLERIQNNFANHAELLRDGYPVYKPHFGSADAPIQTWRTHLLVLQADREELITHALAVYVPHDAIRKAGAAGGRGERWGHSVHSPRTMREGEDPVRAYMIEGVANDIWQLEQMAAITVEHQRRALDPNGTAGELTEQFHRNMGTLWMRARDTSLVIGLNASERTELWDRDAAGWKWLTALTVRGQTDAQLDERQRAYSWRGIEHAARRAIESLPERKPILDPGSEPPDPEALLARATNALNTLAAEPASPDPGGIEGIEIVFDPDRATEWDSGGPTETGLRRPDPGVGNEL